MQDRGQYRKEVQDGGREGQAQVSWIDARCVATEEAFACADVTCIMQTRLCVFVNQTKVDKCSISISPHLFARA